VKKDIQIQQNLLNELEITIEIIRSKKMMSVKEITDLLAAMKLYQEKYFTKEQLDSIKDFYTKMDKDERKAAEKNFNTILDKIRVEKDKGTPASNSKVRRLAKEWSSMLRSITIGDADIRKQAERFHAETPDNELQFGMDGEIYQYIQEALK